MNGHGSIQSRKAGRYLIDKRLAYGFEGTDPLTGYWSSPRKVLLEAVTIPEEDFQKLFERFLSVQRVRNSSQFMKRILPVANFIEVDSDAVIVTYTAIQNKLDEHLEFTGKLDLVASELFISRLFEVVHAVSVLHSSGVAHGGISRDAIRMNFSEVNLLHFYSRPRTWLSPFDTTQEKSDCESLFELLKNAVRATEECAPSLSQRTLSTLHDWYERTGGSNVQFLAQQLLSE